LFGLLLGFENNLNAWSDSGCAPCLHLKRQKWGCVFCLTPSITVSGNGIVEHAVPQ